jgi:WXG100 family type VII secretion target
MAGAGSQFGVSFDEAQKAAQQVQQVKEELSAELNSLRSQLTPLEGQWSGAAQAAYMQLQERWNQDATKLFNALDEIGQALSGNVNTYSTTESDNAAQIKNMINGL